MESGFSPQKKTTLPGNKITAIFHPPKGAVRTGIRTFFNGKKKLVRENHGSKNIELGLPAAKPRNFFLKLIPNIVVQNPNLVPN